MSLPSGVTCAPLPSLLTPQKGQRTSVKGREGNKTRASREVKEQGRVGFAGEPWPTLDRKALRISELARGPTDTWPEWWVKDRLCG